MKRLISVLSVIVLLMCSFSFVTSAIDTSKETKLINAIKNKDKKVDLGQIDDLQTFVNEFIDRNPEYFYFYPQGCSFWSNGTVDLAYYDWGDDEIAQFNNVLNEIALFTSDMKTDLEKVIFIHEYLMENCEYNYEYTGFTAYDCLIKHKCVCEGYTKAFVCLMHKLNIECSMITSDINNHAWNVVKIDNKYYYIDVTHDDAAGKIHSCLISSEDKMKKNYHAVCVYENGTYGDWTLDAVRNVTTLYNNTTYDNAFWANAKNIMNYDNGTWYYTDGLDIYSCNYPDTPKKLTNHKEADYRWYVLGEKNYYSDHHSDVVVLGDRLYYTTYCTIRSMDKDGKNDKLEYTLTSAEMKKGYIYDLRVIDNKIYYYLATEPNTSVTYTGSLSASFHVHTMSDWVTVEEATAENDGVQMRQCTASGCTYTESQTVKYTAPVVEFLLGDVDFNNKINAKDARLILRYSAKLETFTEKQLSAADIDSNGKVNAKDARKVLRISAKLE